MTVIYGLCDPRDGQLRYVGKTSGRLSRRIQAHLAEARSGKFGHKNNWLRTLQGPPEAFVIEGVADDGCEAEIHHIAQLRAIGCQLTNCTAGGQGLLGWKHGAAARAKMKTSHLGKVQSEVHRERNREAHLGQKFTPEAREKMRSAHLGRPMSLTTRARMSAAQTRRWSRVRGGN